MQCHSLPYASLTGTSVNLSRSFMKRRTAYSQSVNNFPFANASRGHRPDNRLGRKEVPVSLDTRDMKNTNINEKMVIGFPQKEKNQTELGQ